MTQLPRSWFKLSGLFLFFSLSACSHAPSLGEKMILQGSHTQALGEKWTEGHQLVEKGNKQIKNGEEMLKKGERLVNKGKANIRVGRKMVKQGQKMMEKSESSFQE